MTDVHITSFQPKREIACITTVEHANRKLVLGIQEPRYLGFNRTLPRSGVMITSLTTSLMQPPRRQKDAAYVDTKTAKLPIKMLHHLISVLRSKAHLGSEWCPHVINRHFRVNSTKTRQSVWHMHI